MAARYPHSITYMTLPSGTEWYIPMTHYTNRKKRGMSYIIKVWHARRGEREGGLGPEVRRGGIAANSFSRWFLFASYNEAELNTTAYRRVLGEGLLITIVGSQPPGPRFAMLLMRTSQLAGTFCAGGTYKVLTNKVNLSILAIGQTLEKRTIFLDFLPCCSFHLRVNRSEAQRTENPNLNGCRVTLLDGKSLPRRKRHHAQAAAEESRCRIE